MQRFSNSALVKRFSQNLGYFWIQIQVRWVRKPKYLKNFFPRDAITWASLLGYHNLSPEDLSAVVDLKLLVRPEFRQINLASGHHTGIFEEIKMHFENPGSGNQRGCSRPKLEISFGRRLQKERKSTVFFQFLFIRAPMCQTWVGSVYRVNRFW